MEKLLYWLALGLVKGIQALPLGFVARAGRVGGTMAFWLDARHRRVARRNLALAFPEKCAQEVEALARENFRRIGENFACAAKTAGMTYEQLKERVIFDIRGIDAALGEPNGRWLVAIGHFGNFELFSLFGQYVPRFQCATTYRGLRQRVFNALLNRLRQRPGCHFFERRTDGANLRKFMNHEAVILGLLSDQHAGDGGIPLPFFGRQCSTSAAPALFALRYNCRLITAFCFRTGLARWRIETGDEIRTHHQGQPRGVADLMLDVNQALERAVRRDPANWFWVHNRWKKKWLKPRAGAVASPPTLKSFEPEAPGNG